MIFGTVGIAFLLIIIFLLAIDAQRSSSFIDSDLQNLTASASVASIQDVVFMEQASSGLPINLKIPKIGVNAAIEYVGLTSQGAMDVPKVPKNAAWFNLGPRPGEKGSAVIAGHFGWKNNIPAIFDNLSKLHKGDKIYVVDKNGVTTTFVVRELRTFSESDDSSAVFGSSDGKSHLNLVTCEGAWNKTKKSYSKRLVVFTDKE